MRRVQNVASWIAIISLIVNIYFVQMLWKRATHANRYLWGNMTSYVIAGVTWADVGTDPEARVALATLDLMRSLPRYSQRIEADHLLTIEDFLRKASQVRAKAIQEREHSGTYTEETARQLAEVELGFTLLLDNLHRVNDLQKEAYALNDAAWRAMWTDIVVGLRKINLN